MNRTTSNWRNLVAENRIVLLLAMVFAVMSLIAPHFFTIHNQTTILGGMSLNVLPVIGLTLVMICGHIDLSIGTSITLGGMLTIGLQPALGWPGAILAGSFAGLALGTINGLLVARLKIDSFIVTLGAMIVTQGAVYIYGKGGVLTAPDFELGEWLEQPVIPLLTPRIIISLSLGVLFGFLLTRTPHGRGFFYVGGSAEAARTAGLPVRTYLIGAFALSGMFSALGGALFSVSISSAMPTMGNNSLMEVITAVIIGGTAMTGGRGSIIRNMLALLALTMLYNGLELMGAGWEARKMSAGFVLGAVILYEAVVERRERLRRGVRHELLEELEQEYEQDDEDYDPDEPSEEPMRPNQSNSALIICITSVACVAIVAIVAMYLLHLRTPVTVVQGPGGGSVVSSGAPVAAEDVDLSTLKSVDGQLLLPPPITKEIPPRPADPEALDVNDPMHWYDMEYAGWNVEKVNMPTSPGDGPKGKKVIYLQAVDHPYQTAMFTGMKKVADAYGVEISSKNANSDINIQSQQVRQVITQRPDFVIMSPVDSQACVPLVRRLNEAGIPVIAINLLPVQEAHKYLLAWTGPDDWGQMRLLARKFAELMGNKGKYVILQHRPGSSPFFSRTNGPITELKMVAPGMEVLAVQTTDLESEKTKEVVSGWLTRFGDELTGIFSADDSGTQTGINQAVKDAGREDIIRVAAGNSKVGMDFVKEGTLHAITFQSPEADGAIPMKLAVDWFSGEEIPPIRYLPQAIITKENVDEYLPAQW